MPRRRYGSTAVRDEDEADEPLLDVARCDHYPNSDDDDDGVPTPRRRRANSAPAKIKMGRFQKVAGLLVPPLVVVACLGLFYSYGLQRRVTALSVELRSATGDIALLSSGLALHSAELWSMNATLRNQSSVIARFERSVSNSDVLHKLEELERDSKEREERVEGEMEATRDEVSRVLDDTKKEIHDTVGNATEQINSQVLSVQSTLSTYIRTTQDQFSTENSFMIYQLAGTFTLLGCLISMWHMTAHLRHFRQPFVQRKVLAILWMCPIYSVTSWLSLVLPGMEGYLAILKDMYEAYVIYQFLSFCVAVLGKGDRDAVVDLLARHADHLSPPFKCFGCFRKKFGWTDVSCEDEKRQLADDVLLQCQLCAVQFVFLRPLLTAALFALKKLDYHGPMFGPGSPFDSGDTGDADGLDPDDIYGGGGILDYRSPQFYIMLLENVSVFLAFSGLLKFYHAVQEDLSWCRPFPKFLCIKGVVFMTFWQGVGISLLANTTDLLGGGGEHIDAVDGDTTEEERVEAFAKQGQNFLICLEMLGFAIAHFYCFPVDEWEEGYRPAEDTSRFGDKIALGDFVHDLKTILRHNERKKRTTKEKAGGGTRPSSEDSISTVLEEDEESGLADSGDDKLQALLENVEDLLESGGDTAGGAKGGKKGGKDPSPDEGEGVDASAPQTSRKSVQESLEAMNAPTELRRATALLLQSTLLDENTARLLTGDILDRPMEPGSLDHDGDGEEGHADEDISDRKGSKRSPEDLDGREEAVVEKSPEGVPKGGDASASLGEPQPLESTSSLPASKVDEVLKPSIFTMHSKDEDAMDGEESNSRREEAIAAESLTRDDASAPSVANATSAEGETQPSGSSSLLPASKNDEMLRPSIFTMHSTSSEDNI